MRPGIRPHAGEPLGQVGVSFGVAAQDAQQAVRAGDAARHATLAVLVEEVDGRIAHPLADVRVPEHGAVRLGKGGLRPVGEDDPLRFAMRAETGEARAAQSPATCTAHWRSQSTSRDVGLPPRTQACSSGSDVQGSAARARR
jgi:hypothetical protein